MKNVRTEYNLRTRREAQKQERLHDAFLAQAILAMVFLDG